MVRPCPCVFKPRGSADDPGLRINMRNGVHDCACAFCELGDIRDLSWSLAVFIQLKLFYASTNLDPHWG